MREIGECVLRNDKAMTGVGGQKHSFHILIILHAAKKVQQPALHFPLLFSFSSPIRVASLPGKDERESTGHVKSRFDPIRKKRGNAIHHNERKLDFLGTNLFILSNFCI